jgi:hypothetical protein
MSSKAKSISSFFETFSLNYNNNNFSFSLFYRIRKPSINTAGLCGKINEEKGNPESQEYIIVFSNIHYFCSDIGYEINWFSEPARTDQTVSINGKNKEVSCLKEGWRHPRSLNVLFEWSKKNKWPFFFFSTPNLSIFAMKNLVLDPDPYSVDQDSKYCFYFAFKKFESLL